MDMGTAASSGGLDQPRYEDDEPDARCTCMDQLIIHAPSSSSANQNGTGKVSDRDTAAGGLPMAFLTSKRLTYPVLAS
jgi:hypothetical protein